MSRDGGVYEAGASQGVIGGVANYAYVLLKYVPAPDILFGPVERMGDATVHFTLSAPTNVAYRLDASPDLTNWLTLTSFPALPVTSLQYTDTLAPSFPTRFYRAIWSP